MTPSPAWHKLRRRLAGVVFLAVFGMLAWLSVAVYQKQFSTVASVTLYTDSVGNEMHIGGQVMLRGVQVGEVRQISSDGRGARLQLALQPGMLRYIPADVSAEMLPTTLFGERYVDLIPPTHPGVARLTSGGVIRQDRSRDALELEKVLNNLLPTLRAAQPDKLSMVLTALGQGLQGRGKELGATLVQLNSYLGQLNPHLPRLDRDIAELAALARTYRKASPDLLAALNDFAVNGQTIAEQSANVAALFANVTTASSDLRSFLSANSANIIGLSADSTATLAILARYSAEFPCTLRDLVRFEPVMNKVLGAGTSQPGMHVSVIVVPSMGRYLPNHNAPVYGDNLGPHCYPVPFPGIHLNDGAGSPAGSTAAAGSKASGAGSGHGGVSGHGAGSVPGGAGSHSGAVRPAGTAGRTMQPAGGAAPFPFGAPGVATTALGLPPLAGSPQEDELVRELAGLALGRPASALPAWTGLLIAPLYRGAHVVLGVRRA